MELTKTIKTCILEYLKEKFSEPITEELLEAYTSAHHVPTIQEEVRTEMMESAAAVHRESTPESTEPSMSSSEAKKLNQQCCINIFTHGVI